MSSRTLRVRQARLLTCFSKAPPSGVSISPVRPRRLGYLAERAGRALKPIVLELGGYNPMIVLSDADLAHAVNATAFGAFLHQGQVCMCTRKVFVERSIHDEFVDRLTAVKRSLSSREIQQIALSSLAH